MEISSIARQAYLEYIWLMSSVFHLSRKISDSKIHVVKHFSVGYPVIATLNENVFFLSKKYESFLFGKPQLATNNKILL